MTIVRAVLASLLIVVLALSWVDPDLWGHVRFGGDILVTRELPVDDIYSFTSDIPWVNHEWLSETILAAAFLTGGNTGLILLKLSLVIGTLALPMRGVWRSGRDVTIQDALLALLSAGIWIRAYVIRPQLFSLFCFAVLLSVLRDADAGRLRPLAWLPLVFGFWVNLHGGWVVGAGMLALWAAASTLTSRTPKRAIALTVAASAAATLVNPYGFEMWGFLAETVRPERPAIDDWRPLYATPALLPFWLPVAAAAAFGLWRGRRSIPLSHALIVLALAIASVRVSRLDAFFAIATVTFLGPSIATARSIQTRFASVPRRTRHLAAATAVAVLIAAAAGTQAFRCISMDGLDWLPEREAGAAMRAGALQGRMITWFGWGEYALWHLAPAVRVSLDGRRETVYSDEYLSNHLRLYWAPEQTADFLRTLDADLAWLPRDLPLGRFLEREGWSKIFDGSRSIVLSRSGRDALPRAAAFSGSRCFPGP